VGRNFVSSICKLKPFFTDRPKNLKIQKPIFCLKLRFFPALMFCISSLSGICVCRSSYCSDV